MKRYVTCEIYEPRLSRQPTICWVRHCLNFILVSVCVAFYLQLPRDALVVRSSQNWFKVFGEVLIVESETFQVEVRTIFLFSEHFLIVHVMRYQVAFSEPFTDLKSLPPFLTFCNCRCFLVFVFDVLAWSLDAVEFFLHIDGCICWNILYSFVVLITIILDFWRWSH